MYGPLSDPYFVLLVLCCAAVITIGAIVTALNRIPRAELARFQNELKELSGRVKVVEAAEQRRFMGDLNSHSAGAEATSANGSGGLEPRAHSRDVRKGFARNADLQQLGRPRIDPTPEKRVQNHLQAGKGILKMAKECGVGSGTVQRIAREMRGKRPFDLASAAA